MKKIHRNKKDKNPTSTATAERSIMNFTQTPSSRAQKRQPHTHAIKLLLPQARGQIIIIITIAHV